MKRSNKKKKIQLFYKILSFILVILTVLLAGVLIYNNVLLVKYLIILLTVLFALVLLVIYKLNSRNRLFTKLVCSTLGIITIVLEIMGLFALFGAFNLFDVINSNRYVYESYGLYVLSDSNIKDIKDLTNEMIATYFENEDSQKLALDKLLNIKKFDYKVLDSQSKAISDVKEGKYKALYIGESFMDIYLEEHPEEFILIKSFEIKYKNVNSFNEIDVTKKPFAVYLSGVDSYGKVNNSARSDVNLLLVVNPKTGKVLIINTPRDYYVTLNSKNAQDKLTHAGIYGISESAKTLGDLYDLEVNYYARVNFTSFVKIIDKLGGVTVNVEKPDYSYNLGINCGNKVCEQNSKRQFGSNMIYITPGVRTLSGEEALSYVRNRHQYKDGDLARGRHQQDVLTAIVDKAISPVILTKYMGLMDALSEGIKTNIDQKTVTKLVNYQLDKNINWQVETINATGKDAYKACYSTGTSKLYVIEPDEEVLIDIKNKINETMSL